MEPFNKYHFIFRIKDKEGFFNADITIHLKSDNYLSNDSERLFKELKDIFAPHDVVMLVAIQEDS